MITDEHGLVEDVKTHPANTSEMTGFEEDINSSNIQEGQRLLYDKGAASKSNREALKKLGLKDGIMQKKPKGKPTGHWQKIRNRLISSRGFVTECSFGTMKRVYGLSRTRYIGIVKVHFEVLLKSLAYNLKTQDNCV